jgi:hypothetical protein
MVWKEIENFPGYQVSSTGEVKSTKYWGQFTRINNDGILKQRTYKSGYKYVNLYKNGHMYSVKVHRLVAQAFISNPLNYKQVNHKDEVKSNNNVSNLEWCDQSYNLTYNGLSTRIHKKQKRRIGAFNIEGNLIQEFDSATSAALFLVKLGKAASFNSAACNISTVARKRQNKERYGYYWKWLESSKRSDTQ